MQPGQIHKVAVAAANISDSTGLKHLCSKARTVYGDKGYRGKTVARTIKINVCHKATIKKKRRRRLRTR